MDMRPALHTNEPISRKGNVFYKLMMEGYLHVFSGWPTFLLCLTDLHLDSDLRFDFDHLL